jgi:hypothetical protein
MITMYLQEIIMSTQILEENTLILQKEENQDEQSLIEYDVDYLFTLYPEHIFERISINL